MPSPFANAVVLTGPTASGKSALALDWAVRLGAEIVALDSMTLYRGMDVGTAKPSVEDRRRVPHHLIDVLDPWQSSSVAWWLERAAESARDIENRGRRALFVGGTPLYLKAMLCGLFDGPPADAELRRRLEGEAEALGRQALHERLARCDPATAARLHVNDLRRIIRALEVHELTGKPIGELQEQWGRPASDAPAVSCLDVPREELYRRIDERVVAMFANGLVEEVEALRRLPQPLSPEAAQAVGYQEVMDFLDGRATRDEAVRTMQTRTRHFAKRQLTWFRGLPVQLVTPESLGNPAP
jgi:tRNA dimethylallyltransferase